MHCTVQAKFPLQTSKRNYPIMQDLSLSFSKRGMKGSEEECSGINVQLSGIQGGPWLLSFNLRIVVCCGCDGGNRVRNRIIFERKSAESQGQSGQNLARIAMYCICNVAQAERAKWGRCAA